MDKNVKIAKELVKLAKSMVALDKEDDKSEFQVIHDMENSGMHSLDSKKDIEKFEQEELDKAEKEEKKYILYKKEGNLWRIRACKNFNNVKKGDLGGLIEGEENLDHRGDCWVYDDAKVYGKAYVGGDAVVGEHAQVYGNAQVYGDAHVFGDNVQVYDHAEVCSGCIWDDAQIYGGAKIYSDVLICEEAKVYGRAIIYDGKLDKYGIKIEEISGNAEFDGTNWKNYFI